MWRTVALVVGVAAHLAVGIFYLAIGLVVPGVAIPFFWAFWIFLLVVTVKHRHDPRWVLAVPVVAAIVALHRGVDRGARVRLDGLTRLRVPGQASGVRTR